VDRRIFVVGSVAALMAALRVDGQPQTSTEEQFFGIEWQLERAGDRDVAVVGLLSNRYRHPLRWARLQAQIVDVANPIVHEAFAVVRDVPAGGRVTFRLPLPASGARYIVVVHGFEFGTQAQESP
jgi:hypothetical protein